MLRVIIIASIVLSVLPAVAEDAPRKINFQTIIADQDGIPLVDCLKVDDATPNVCAKKSDMTLGRLAMRALTVQYPQEAPVTGEDQVHRALLAQEIYKGGEISDLNTKDIDLLCTSIAKFVNKAGLTSWATLQAWSILDPQRIKK
jgi:hypothetical protein